ncbi:MAG TPA: DUF1778 domain-containing protein [Thiolinea sp.]|nr:DUF1778 domain-containing protein [Thiolinea sp.]
MLPLSERINLRTTAEVKSLLSRAAGLRGLSLSSFLLESARHAAEEVLKGQEQIVLSASDWEKFAAILDDETPPNAVLQAAARKFREHSQ